MALSQAHRIGRFLEREGFPERDAKNSYLTLNAGKRGRWTTFGALHYVPYRSGSADRT